MKILRRVMGWAGVGANIWAAYWLLIVGSFLVVGSAMLKWVAFPYSHHPYGLQLPLLRNIELVPHLSFLSYGILGAGVLAAGLVLFRRSLTSLAVAAALLIAMWVAAPCQIAFQQPTLLARLTAETREVPMIRSFSKTFLSPNYGLAEDFPKHFNLDTLGGRFLAACSFLDLGWYCFGTGALLIAIYSIARLRAERGMTALALSGIPIAALVLLLGPAFIGQHYFTSARTAQALGQNEKAIAHYRKAALWDRWHQQEIGVYAAIGDLEKVSGVLKDSPEKHISRAEEFRATSEYEPAVYELSRAAAWGGAPAMAARRESARTRVDFGIALYRGGGIGAAVTQWQQALNDNPLQQQGLAFLIARGNYDLGGYKAALDMVQRVLRTSGDRPILANAYSLAGDCYAKLGQDAEARASYNRSLKEDMSINFWAMSGLIGN